MEKYANSININKLEIIFKQIVVNQSLFTHGFRGTFCTPCLANLVKKKKHCNRREYHSKIAFGIILSPLHVPFHVGW